LQSFPLFLHNFCEFLFLVNYFSSFLIFLHLTFPQKLYEHSFSLMFNNWEFFSFSEKWRTSELLSRELQMMSEEELGVTSRIGLEGFVQELGKL
jgi:hypothetical protein